MEIQEEGVLKVIRATLTDITKVLTRFEVFFLPAGHTL